MSTLAALRPRGTFGAIRRPRRGLRSLRGIQGMRRATQVAVALAILAVTLVRALSTTDSGPAGATTPEGLCPFGGIETIGTFIATGGYVPHVHTANLVLAVALLLVAFFARGAFCGWICPLGFLQDLTSGFGRLVKKRVPPVRRAVRALEARAKGLARLDRPLRLLKYAVLGWAVIGAAYFGVMVFRDVDPWIALLDFGRETAGFGLLVLGILLVASFFVDRPWCRYACPLGAANGVVARLSPVFLRRDTAACVDCKACSRACPMGLPVATAMKITAADCIGCLECVEACPREGALELAVGMPISFGRAAH